MKMKIVGVVAIAIAVLSRNVFPGVAGWVVIGGLTCCGIGFLLGTKDRFR